MKEAVAKRKERLQSGNGIRVGMLKRMFGFLSPLSIFIPQRIRDNPLKRGRDWDLTLLVVAYGFTVTIMVSLRLNSKTQLKQIPKASYPFKFQYAAAVFGWTSEIVNNLYS
jgi:hypothetical protein